MLLSGVRDAGRAHRVVDERHGVALEVGAQLLAARAAGRDQQVEDQGALDHVEQLAAVGVLRELAVVDGALDPPHYGEDALTDALLADLLEVVRVGHIKLLLIATQ